MCKFARRRLACAEAICQVDGRSDSLWGSQSDIKYASVTDTPIEIERSVATSDSLVSLLCGSPVGCPKLQIVNENVSVDDLVLNNPSILHG